MMLFEGMATSPNVTDMFLRLISREGVGIERVYYARLEPLFHAKNSVTVFKYFFEYPADILLCNPANQMLSTSLVSLLS